MQIDSLVIRFLLLFLLSFVHFAASSPQPKKSNILFILTDDQRWDTLGCYGNKIVKTPHLDKLAAQGARLDSFYVAAPLCCPSRAVFLTGLYPHQTKVRANTKGLDIPVGTKTVADHLNAAGYLSGFIGKAHLGGDPRKWGFRECPVVLPGGNTELRNHKLVVDGKMQNVSGMISEIFVDSAIKFVQTHKNETWFLWLALTAPHQPYEKDPKYAYNNAAEQMPPGWHSSWKFNPIHWNPYYATITALDEQVGRLLAELDRLGLAQDTFVMMTSDNGYMFGSHNVGGKASWFEGSSRVPGIVRWPGRINPASKIKTLLSSVDVLPTFSEIAEKPLKTVQTSESILTIMNARKPVRDTIFSELKNWRMIRKGPWKFVVERGKKAPHALYNIDSDPFEMTNLASRPEHQETILALKNELEEWTRQTPVLSGAGKRKVKDEKKEKSD